jgi:hypothetical protein
VCCASVGAERRGGVLCAGPAYVVKNLKSDSSELHGGAHALVGPDPAGF